MCLLLSAANGEAVQSKHGCCYLSFRSRDCVFFLRKKAHAFENGMSDGLSESHLKIISYETTTNARGPTTTLKITRLLSMLGWRDGLQQPCRQHSFEDISSSAGEL